MFVQFWSRKDARIEGCARLGGGFGCIAGWKGRLDIIVSRMFYGLFGVGLLLYSGNQFREDLSKIPKAQNTPKSAKDTPTI